MSIRFVATRSECAADDEATACAVYARGSNDIFYILSFIHHRDLADARDPAKCSRISFSFGSRSGHAQAAYFDAETRCRLTRRSLSVFLSSQLASFFRTDEFVVDLEISDGDFDVVKEGLIQIFCGLPDAFVVDLK